MRMKTVMLKRTHQWTIEVIIMETTKMTEAMEMVTTAEATETATTAEMVETMDNVSKVKRRPSNLPSYVEPPSRIPRACSLRYVFYILSHYR